MSLLEKMLKSGSLKTASVLSKSSFFNAKDPIPTDLPILNVAFSGTLDGGLLPGLTVLAGLSKSFKTMLSLYCMKAYLDKYKDGIALLYDSEFGITPEYMQSFNIDLDRVVHIPITNIEELKFDVVQRIEQIEKKDRVFMMIDSVGNLASKKEVDDAANEKSVADMTRAKQLKSLFRIITPYLTTKNIPCVVVNHIYMTQELYSKPVVSGGTGIYYSANQIFIITKSQAKDGDQLAGFNFTINIEKSRYVKEKSKLPFTVFFNGGIQRWSSLFELAMEAGHIVKPKVGWYNFVDMETGEILPKSYRAKDVEANDEFFMKLIKHEQFKDFVEKKFKLSAAKFENADTHDVLDEDEDMVDELDNE